MSLVETLTSMLRCPGCSQQRWDIRARGADDLAALEGTVCCGNCGQAFAARGGVLDMVPSAVEDRAAALRRRLESPPAARLYEERIRHALTPLASPLRAEDRQRWLETHGPAQAPSHVVDFGCGRGSDLEIMRKSCRPELAVGVDLSEVLLAEAARSARAAGVRNVAFVKADLEDLPLRRDCVDWASCFGVLHRLGDPSVALSSMASTLSPGAVFTCLTTLRLDEGALSVGQRAVGALGRVHLFDRDAIEGMSARAGLSVEALEPWGPVAMLSARRLSPT